MTLVDASLRSGQVAFKPRARLMKLIGAELISDDVVAVTELVKNAHDADAGLVRISFSGVTESGGEIVIEDDGTGMDAETLLTSWMQPASSWKSTSRKKRTRRGRRVLGEKGVGRFASDKLARYLELVSRPRSPAEEIWARFDWDQYDCEDVLLSQVKNHWEVRKPQALKSSGTILRLSGLREPWTEKMFRRLTTRLGRLISPFSGIDSFRVEIASDEFPEYSGELRTDFLKKAPYRITASFDGGQTVEFQINRKKTARTLWNGAGALRCGPVRLRLYAFDLETESLARLGPRMEVRAWLREWSGVSIYRDGFRIWPYGEPHDDWLRLDQRRVNNPVLRLSNNQIVGFVEISGDANPHLRDQTNREGLVNNAALGDLRRLVAFVMQILEAERQEIRHPHGPRTEAGSRTTYASAPSHDSLDEALEKLASDPHSADKREVRRLIRQLAERREQEHQHQQRLLAGYADLAALGQAVTKVGDSVEPIARDLRRSLDALANLIDGRQVRGASPLMRNLQTGLAAVEQRLALLAPLDNRGLVQRRRTLDIQAELQGARAWLEPMLGEHGIRLEIEMPRRGVLRAELRPDVLARVLHVLASNTIEWTRTTVNPRLRIQASAMKRECHLLVSDNGPGVPVELSEAVFAPLYSGKEDGRGMGLTLARQLLEPYGGSINLDTDGRRTGANFRVILPRKRPRAT